MIVVIGQPRSGTSLTMQMLAAIGLRCAGEYPAFEDLEQLDAGIADLADNEAIKIVWPAKPPSLPRAARCIVIKRNRAEQVASEIKLRQLVQLGQDTWHRPPRKHRRAMMTMWLRYELQIEKYVRGHDVLHLAFEDVITYPRVWALQLMIWLADVPHAYQPPQGLLDQVAAVVRSRPTHCLPGMLEGLIAEGLV